MSARSSYVESAINAAVYSTICVIAYQFYNYKRAKSLLSPSEQQQKQKLKLKNKDVLESKKKKLIVVTGCDRGFGRMIVESMVSSDDDNNGKFQNYIVLALTLTEENATSLTSNKRLYAMKCDVTNDTDVAQAAEYACEILESDQAILYGICNNAGIADPGNCLFFHNVDIYKKVMDVNYLGQIRITQAMLPLMMRTSQVYGGRIINLSSVCGAVASPGNSSYNASKFAVEAWSDSLRIELKAFNIDVTKIRPGAIKTEIQRDWQNNFTKNLHAAPTIVREYYGQEKFDQAVKEQLETALDAQNPPALVVDSIVDLLTLQSDMKLDPYYWIGNDAKTFWKALADLPTKVTDTIKQSMTFYPQLPYKLPPTHCVSHITIHVRDIQKSLPFYKAFGLEILGDMVDGQQFLSTGTSSHPWNTLVLLSEDPSMSVRDKCFDAGEARLCIISLDIQKDMKQLSDGGYESMAPMVDGKDEKICVYEDPDGFVVYMIELKGFLSKYIQFSKWWNKKEGPIVFHWTFNVMDVKNAMSVFQKLGFQTVFDIPKDKVIYELLPAFNIDENQSVIEDIRLCKLPTDTLLATLMEWTDPKTTRKGTEHLNCMTISVDDVDEALSAAKEAGMHVDEPPTYKQLPLFGHVRVGTAYVESPKTCKIEFCSFTNKSLTKFKVRTTPERPKLLLIGDSLTQTSFEGWGAGLANRYQRRADVINRGLSGYNTRWGLRYAEDYGMWKEPGHVVLVTIFFGANDAAIIDRDPSKHVPVPEYKENLHKYVDLVKKYYPTAKILLITPPPIHRGQRLAFQKQRYGNKATGVAERTSEHTSKYVSACLEVGTERSIPTLDLFNGMIQAGGDGGKDKDNGAFGKFLSDGLHFSPTGHDFVLREVVKSIESNFPDIAVHPDKHTGQPNNSGSKSTIPSSGPYHDQINYKKWEDAFN